MVVSPRQVKARILTRSTTPMKLAAEPILDGVDAEVEARAGPVQLVDKANPGDPVPVGLTPDGLALRLHAGDAVEHSDGTIEHPQRTLHLDRKVDVAGGVDDVDLMIFPVTGRRGGGDRDAALLLLRHPVHRRSTFVHFTDLVVDAGVEQNALSRGRLARVDVGHDPDVADLGQVSLDVDSHGVASTSP